MHHSCLVINEAHECRPRTKPHTASNLDGATEGLRAHLGVAGGQWGGAGGRQGRGGGASLFSHHAVHVALPGQLAHHLLHAPAPSRPGTPRAECRCVESSSRQVVRGSAHRAMFMQLLGCVCPGGGSLAAMLGRQFHQGMAERQGWQLRWWRCDHSRVSEAANYCLSDARM